MPTIQFNQSNFNRGEIDALLSARFDYEDFDKSVKRARNCVTLPQGGIQRRFGTTLVGQYALSNPNYIDVFTLQYDNSATFLVVFYPQKFDVYLENTKFQSATASGSPVYQAEDIYDLKVSQVQDRMIVTHPSFKQRQLQLNSVSQAITGFNATTDILTVAAGVITNQIFPVTFSTTGTLPATSPQIYAGRTYYALGISAGSFQLYATPADAKAQANVFQISSAGTATTTAKMYNVWAITDIVINTYPAYDFGDVNYSGFTFLPDLLEGNPGSLVTLTSSSAIFTTAYIGGAFIGGGGVLRITATPTTTTCKGYTIRPFTGVYDTSTSTYIPVLLPGAQCFVGEPVWSATRGYPRCSTAFQGRLFFAGTSVIPNGIWGSNVNALYEFDDTEAFPDNAISYYPASGNITYIQAMTAARSLLAHTNTGSFSTALSTEQPLTPNNVSFTEQNKDGCSDLVPIFIDNQIIYVDSSRNNIKNLIWELNQSSYVLRNISIVSSSLIRKPVDLASYSNPLFIDGSYAFFVNGDGTLATFNTLYTENVGGWSLQNTHQWRDSTGTDIEENSFINIASSFNQSWFLVNRIIYTATSITDILSIDRTDDTFVVNGVYADVEDLPWGVILTFDDQNLQTFPQVTAGTMYYARESTTSKFALYETWSDAQNQVNPVLLQILLGAQITLLQPTSSMFLEQLNFSVSLDAVTRGSIVAGAFVPTPAPFAGSLTPYEGQWVYVYVAGFPATQDTEDGPVPLGYVLGPVQVLGGAITGLGITTATSAYIGFPFQTLVEMLPSQVELATGNNFYRQKLLRDVYFYYYQSVGFKINGVSVPTKTIATYPLNEPLVPTTGIVDFPPMVGWTNLEQTIQVTQDLPLPFTLLGWSAVVELT